MLSRKLKSLWLSLFVMIGACNRVEVPNIEWCASIGIHGALCQHSISEDKRQLSIDEFIYFLESQEDDKATPENEEKGPALCTSSNDFARVKTTIEQLCHKAGNKCTYEDKKMIKNLDSAYQYLVRGTYEN